MKSAVGGCTAEFITPLANWLGRSIKSFPGGRSTSESFTVRRCLSFWRASMPYWCVGSVTNIGGMTPHAGAGRNCWNSLPSIRVSSGIGSGSPPRGEEVEKSPEAGDCHAGICWSRRVKFPPGVFQAERNQREVGHFFSVISFGWLIQSGPGRAKIFGSRLVAYRFRCLALAAASVSLRSLATDAACPK